MPTTFGMKGSYYLFSLIIGGVENAAGDASVAAKRRAVYSSTAVIMSL
jgi:hypothetical protein